MAPVNMINSILSTIRKGAENKTANTVSANHGLQFPLTLVRIPRVKRL